jgi:predicted nuclease with TOPRIM domain
MSIDLVEMENRVAALERRMEDRASEVGKLHAQIYNLKMKCRQLAVELKYCRRSSSAPESMLGSLTDDLNNLPSSVDELRDFLDVEDTVQVCTRDKKG